MIKYEKAIQFNGNFEEIEKFVGGNAEWRNGELIVATREGALHAKNYDFIIKTVDGKFCTCQPDVFLKTYERIIPYYYLCDCCKDTDEPDDEAIYTCKTCESQICNACVVNLEDGDEIPCDDQHNIDAKYCPFCTNE